MPVKTKTKKRPAANGEPIVEMFGVVESPLLPDHMRRLNAAGKWPKPPSPKPSLDEAAEIMLEDANRMRELTDIVHCVQICVGQDSASGGTYVNFAQFIWHPMYGGIQIFIPHGASREDVVASLEETQQFIMNYWGGLLVDPVSMSNLVYEQKHKGWKDAQRRNPKPVSDDDPSTWPQERRDEADRLARHVGFMELLGNRDFRELVFDRWLSASPKRQEATAWADYAADQLKKEMAELRKAGAK
jgi:hypothetical protein